MPDGPLVDAHLHLWDPHRFPMSWIEGNPTLDRPYGIVDYRAHTAGLDVAAMVYLQVEVAPPYALLEARWAVDRVGEDERLRGIVPWAPLEEGERVRTFLDALVALGPLIKGVRRITQGEPDPAFCLEPGFVRGARILPEYGLSCDLCITHSQLPATTELVRRCPETSFVLDHLGKPDVRGGGLDPWREQIGELAALPNVACKVSGIVTEADHRHWTVADIAPYVAHVLAAFGEDRVLFGGDWPVVLNAAEYPRWVAALDELTAGLTPEAKQKLWAENAKRFYRLA